MPTSAQHFSISTVLLTAFITFIFSGLLGALFRDWLDRPKAFVVLSSIGFEGEQSPVKITEELRKLSRASNWCNTFHRYEDYDILKETAESQLRIQARLRLALPQVDAWIQEHSSWESNVDSKANLAEIADCPYFSDYLIHNVIVGTMRRSEVQAPPVQKVDLDSADAVTELTQTEEGWVLYLRSNNIIFPTKDVFSDFAKQQIHSLALSFSKGSKQNIFHFIKEFKRISFQELENIDQLCKGLEKLLLPASYLVVNAMLINAGARPFTLRPFGKLNFLHDDLATIAPILAFVKKTEQKPSGALDSLFEKKQTGRSDEVHVESFLPKAGDSNYVCVPPKSSIPTTLRSREPLGETGGQRIRDLYDTSVLKCSIKLVKLEGSILKSTPSIFGSQASQDDLKHLG